jgi:hypothetical protein
MHIIVDFSLVKTHKYIDLCLPKTQKHIFYGGLMGFCWNGKMIPSGNLCCSGEPGRLENLLLIAAGSLREFTLQEIPTYGVGSIRSLFVHPFSFNEFLVACNQSRLLDVVNQASESEPVPGLVIPVTHSKS